VPGVFRVKLTKRQRLTPPDYHRNIFHLEMDTTGTGLTYNIGDALGVFGHNDKDEVDEFLAWCVPAPVLPAILRFPAPLAACAAP